VRRFQRVFPGQRIAPGRRNAFDDERGTGGETYWWEHDDVVLGVQVTDLGKGLGAHVVVWNANVVEGHAPPAFGLREEPGVDVGDARGTNGMRLHVGRRGERDCAKAETHGGLLKGGAADVANDEGATLEFDTTGLEAVFSGVD